MSDTDLQETTNVGRMMGTTATTTPTTKRKVEEYEEEGKKESKIVTQSCAIVEITPTLTSQSTATINSNTVGLKTDDGLLEHHR